MCHVSCATWSRHVHSGLLQGAAQLVAAAVTIFRVQRRILNNCNCTPGLINITLSPPTQARSPPQPMTVAFPTSELFPPGSWMGCTEEVKVRSEASLRRVQNIAIDLDI